MDIFYSNRSAQTSLLKKDHIEMRAFGEFVERDGRTIVKDSILCLQMNLGYACNLNCSHCHVEAGPHRKEKMSKSVIEDCLRFTKKAGVKIIDITGGAPELNPHLRHLITELRKLDSVESIIMRSNLAILSEPEYVGLPEFFAENNVEIIASLPCYLKENVTSQRGTGVYDKNIKVLQKLNRIGYGTSGPQLNLVYNPGGAFLPGPQPTLEAAYKKNLGEMFGITFNSLYTITNMPIGRFRSDLKKQGLLDTYLTLLTDSYNASNLAKIMCRNLISVDWQGQVFDCDFNHILQLPIDVNNSYIGNIMVDDLLGTPVKLGQHCFACTAGTGSSCQGSLIN
jgi:radical SAM/Cys-rich protein